MIERSFPSLLVRWWYNFDQPILR